MENPSTLQNAFHLLDRALPRQVPNDPTHFHYAALALLRDHADPLQAERGPFRE